MRVSKMGFSVKPYSTLEEFTAPAVRLMLAPDWPMGPY